MKKIFIMLFVMISIMGFFQPFFVGFELSEMLEGNFKNDYTFYFGKQLSTNKGLSAVLISADLGVTKSKGNFIHSDYLMPVHLDVARIYYDFYLEEGELYFLKFKPIFMIGTGYNGLKVGEDYDFKSMIISGGFRLRTKFKSFFIEYPVIDVFAYIYKNRDASENSDNLSITYPEWGLLFIWINIGMEF